MNIALFSVLLASIVSPYARHETLDIRDVRLSAERVVCYEKVEMTVDLSATYDNPFDPADIAIDAKVTLPDGRSALVPGFLDRAYKHELKNGQEVVTPAGEPLWRVRFTPWQAGVHSVVIVARDRSGSRESTPRQFTVEKGQDPGFVRISKRDRRYFEFDSGQVYFPIGENICWGGCRGTFSYDDWIPGLGKEGGNYGRLWLSPFWTTFALERPGKPDQGLGMGQFDLGNAWRLDYVLDLARQHGIRLMLCVDSFNILRSKEHALAPRGLPRGYRASLAKGRRGETGCCPSSCEG